MKIKQSIKMNRRAGICLGFLLLCPATQALALHGYTITPLVTPEVNMTTPRDVNDLGMVVGRSSFLWQNGTMTALPSWATAINASGAVVGEMRFPNGTYGAYHYSDGVTTNLHFAITGITDPQYVEVTRAIAINDLGDVIINTESFTQVYLWNNGAQEELYISAGLPRSIDINNAGQVIGVTNNLGQNNNPDEIFLWQNGETYSQFCGSETWQQPCSSESDEYIAAINNNGLAVGHIRSIDHGGMVWDLSAPIPYTPIYGTLIPIEKPIDINDSGVIIGESHFETYNSPPATIYRYDAVNGLHDLNTLIPQYSGWVITSANAISNNGFIVGQGMLNGELTGYLLTPLEDEIDVDLDGFGLLLDCNDNDATINPNAIEIPNDGIDQDCNGTDFIDVDLDGYTPPLDCNDNDPLINPGAVEIPNDGIDQNCSGADLTDVDLDGFDFPLDCNDNDPLINPNAIDIPYDGIDQNCSGADLTDVDLDGFDYPLDCNDNDPLINPGAIEIPDDGIDQNCDGVDLTDVDLDGFNYPLDCNDDDAAINPDAIEIKHDAIDQDCNGYDLTIDITKAVAKTSRGVLSVAATSSLGADAALVVEGFGAMNFNSKKNLWTLSLRKLASAPSVVTVSGIEGSETAQTTEK